jgi:hypothetical protein
MTRLRFGAICGQWHQLGAIFGAISQRADGNTVYDMRVRWFIELPDADPDAAVIRICLGQIPPRRRTEILRKLLAASCRSLLRYRQRMAASPQPHSGSRASQRSAPRRPQPATPSAEDRAAESRRLAALAQRLRVSFVSGGRCYDDTTDALN